MATIADQEALFLEDYWLPMSPPITKPEIQDIDSISAERIADLTGLAVRHVLAGGETETIARGNTLEHSDTNRWLVPGVVLLVEQERLLQLRGCNPKKPCHLKNNKNGDPLDIAELAADPLELLRASAIPKDDKPNSSIVVKPYVKYICDPYRSMHYVRHLRFYGTAYNRSNEIVSCFTSIWVAPGLPLIRSEMSVRGARTNRAPALKLPTEIGTTYEFDLLPIGAGPAVRYLRTTSAHVILREFIRGNARAKKGRRQLALRPMLSPARNF